MNRPATPTANAGGFLLAASLLVGTIIGVMKGEPSIGFMVGLAIGVALAVAVWLLDRR
ncbi:hypothetical protein [Sphingomonas radiodurans]|uniref:hypothetical protein n=1 Tax=Sphingomonas radiodurans TaxID=2890321 RepID=UPI001E3F2D47|nr:hypothetical protein [Sphingomonas radiodurans]WBH17252.1 hypothetical protein LLW23_03850 [Sphingomonas radiodurans]